MIREFKTVLCPVDFSETSYHAAEYARWFAQQANGTLILAHILHNPSSEFFHEAGYVISWDTAKARARALLEETKSKRLDNYSKTELVVDVGDPHDLVVKLARDRKADLIVVATHGRTGIEHLVMGSVAEKVVRYAPCPVFVVRQTVG
jgi:universal stress protein A